MLPRQVVLGQREELSVFGDDYDTPDGTCIRDYMCALSFGDSVRPTLSGTFLEGEESTITVDCSPGICGHTAGTFVS